MGDAWGWFCANIVKVGMRDVGSKRRSRLGGTGCGIYPIVFFFPVLHSLRDFFLTLLFFHKHFIFIDL